MGAWLKLAKSMVHRGIGRAVGPVLPWACRGLLPPIPVRCSAAFPAVLVATNPQASGFAGWRAGIQGDYAPRATRDACKRGSCCEAMSD